MVRVVPFRGYRYNTEKVGELRNVVAPPYDVIKGELLERLHGRSPFNVSQITRGKRSPGDTGNDNEFTRARDFLDRWIQETVLVPEGSEAFYVYAQEFECLGKMYTRWGFVGLLRLEEFGTPGSSDPRNFAGVLQHEETLPKDIEDRLNLLRATRANFGQIFVIYPDAEGEVDAILGRKMEEGPAMEADDGLGVVHKLWVIDDGDDIEGIRDSMGRKFAIIADGHHRYKTALAYMKENPGTESAKYRMLTFVNMSNPGLVVLPTHRLVQHIEGFDISNVMEKLRSDFEVREYGPGDMSRESMFMDMDEEFTAGGHAFGIYANDGNFYGLTLRDEGVMDSIEGRSKAWRKLDVTILHMLVLDRYLGIDREKLAQGTIGGGSFVEYIKGIGDAVEGSIRAVNEGAQAVFFMNPTKVSEVEEVAGNFECMPQKSTFFYPKVYTGLVVNRLD